MRKDSSINREMSCLHHVFTKGVEWDMAEKSPFDKGKSLILKENNLRIRFLNKDETPRLLDNCPEHLSRVVNCAIMTGMRRGKVLTLRYSHLTQDHKRKAVNLLNGLTADENGDCHKSVTRPGETKTVTA